MLKDFGLDNLPDDDYSGLPFISGFIKLEFFLEYLFFLAKVATIGIIVLLALSGIMAMRARWGMSAGHREGYLEVQNLNEQLRSHADAIRSLSMGEKNFRRHSKARKKTAEKLKEERKRLFLIEFRGSLQVEDDASLAHEVSAILDVAEEGDEALVTIESPGGGVSDYGLVAAQMQRLRDRGLLLTAAVDRVAASGGYMVAALANRIIAAPFAIIGSIGVVAEIPNFHRLLRKYDVDFDIYKAGEFKRTVTLFGENSQEGKDKFVEKLQEVHAGFKRLVRESRPGLDIEKIATGDIWMARDALDLGLVDELRTSAEFLVEQGKEKEIYRVRWVRKVPLAERLAQQTGSGLGQFFMRLWGDWTRSRHL